MSDILNYVVASATGGDGLKPLDEILGAYSKMGYKNFEVYAQGRGSSFDITKGPKFFIQKGKEYNLNFSSLHLTKVDDLSCLDLAVKEALFAEAIGINIVVFKASTKEIYVEGLKQFLKNIEGHQITPVIQLHEGGAFNSIADLQEVLNEVDDNRLKILHEVGSFHAFGISWRDVCKAFGKRIGLVHIKDMVGQQSVPFGEGEIDIPALIKCMQDLGYNGYYVIEMANKDKENTRKYIGEALEYIKNNCK